MQLNKYLDSTYLKTAEQAGISKEETKQKVIDLINEAIKYDFVLVMIRPEFVKMARKIIDDAKANVQVGTVIGFHEGTYPLDEKLKEAKQAIDDGVDELDYVVNFEAYKKGNIDLVKKEILEGTKLGLENEKKVKWIIEVAALDDNQISGLSRLIHDVVLENFGKTKAKDVFVKSSTGFYKPTNGKPAGATFEAMKLIIDNAKPLSVKAAGGVKTAQDAIKMIEMGVDRIGTSSAYKIFSGQQNNSNY
ncbi:MAG TPA: deoxyribose-phosphate aldolase [Flavobacteriia bacterium]|nr:deoxyribose-phosphate aldolase [Flavobacteriia bacterium]